MSKEVLDIFCNIVAIENENSHFEHFVDKKKYKQALQKVFCQGHFNINQASLNSLRFSAETLVILVFATK